MPELENGHLVETTTEPQGRKSTARARLAAKAGPFVLIAAIVLLIAIAAFSVR